MNQGTVERAELIITPTLEIEKRYWQQGYERIVGVDEAGRGCLAGPVIAAAVIFRPNEIIPGVRDSKSLSSKQRDELAELIKGVALGYGIGICTPPEIDRLNILWASMEAMRRAIENLSSRVDFVLIDGNRSFKNSPWPLETVVKGDQHSHSIAAASIIAKTTRDELMRKIHLEYPVYGWSANVGYPTRTHYTALAEYGPSPYHRRSFRLNCREATLFDEQERSIES